MWYKNKVELGEETIFELITGEDRLGFGLAVVDVVRSKAHYHRNTTESYALLSGRLIVHLNNIPHLLDRPGSIIKIPIGEVHWAESLDHDSPARISVVTVPAWTPEDHILV